MKQNITPEQLNELSDKGKQKLRKWWVPTDIDLSEHDILGIRVVGTIDSFEKNRSLPLLSIGQMIEFIDEKDQHNIISGEEKGERIWVVEVLWFGGKEYINKELADALWEACKEVLND